jgi:hypothetical protein
MFCRVVFISYWVYAKRLTIEPAFHHSTNPLLVILLSLVVDDVEEAELVDTLGGGDDTEPVTELLLLQELLGPTNPVSVGLAGDRIEGERTST